MSFADPQWLWAALVVPVLILLFIRLEVARRKWMAHWVASRLQQNLLPTVSPWRRRIKFLLAMIGLALLVVAAARPHGGYVNEEIAVQGRDVLLAVDVSKSMLGTDITPDRLTRAKMAAEDLLLRLGGDRVGVIAFAGTAFLQAPLTVDHAAVSNTLRELDPDIIPQGGTNLAAALDVAIEAFGKGEGENRAVVFFSDGEELQEDVVRAAGRAQEAQIAIFAVGTGTEQGSLLPLRLENGGTDFVRDREGKPVRSALVEEHLREVSELTGGEYFNFQDTPDLARVLRAALERVELSERGVSASRKLIERYQYPLAVALAVFLLGFFLRETRIARGAALLLVFMSQPASAMSNRQAYEEGYAAYGKEDYAKAVERFTKATTSGNPRVRSASYYNLANSIALKSNDEKDISRRIAMLEDAVGHYKESKRLNPGNKNADTNRERLEKYIEELKKKQEEQKKEEEQKQDEQKDQQESDSQDQQDQPQESSEQDKGEQSGDQQQQQQESGGKQEESDGEQPQSDEELNTSGASGEQEDKPKEAPGEVEGQEKKDLSGDLESREQPGPEEAGEQEAQPAQPDGQMSKDQAASLLRALANEEDKVQLQQQAPPMPADKDW